MWEEEKMAAAVAVRGGGDGMEKEADAGKYARYTVEQIEALEKVYAECPKPSSMRRQQLIRECAVLSNIEPRQIKVWFQNRRCREKQRKEASRLQAVNRKLTAMNKLLMEENDRLQKQVSQLVDENGYMRQQLQSASLATDTSCESVVTTPQHPLRDANNPAGFLSIAEETLAEFISKATGTAVEWVQMPGMKPGPDSIGIIAISQNCSGVAARACGLVNLEPPKIVDILKDRSSWFQDCRSLEAFTMFPAGNGGTIELLYMQMFAPTTLAPPRDFWTLRYTTSLEDGSLVVCERSLSGTGSGPSTSSSPRFVRTEMLPSGYLIRPCDGGGSIVHIVDHFNFEAWSVPEVLRPLYQSSKLVSQRMTSAALHHIRQIAQETSGEVVYPLERQPAVLRSFSQRLSRGFNDAINGFNDDGWSLMDSDGFEDIIISTNSLRCLNGRANTAGTLSIHGGILCAKTSMLLQDVPPALLIRFLREHRSEWADNSIDAYSAVSLKAGSCSFPGLRSAKFSGNQIIMPLASTVENEEFLEFVRLEGQAVSKDDAILSRDLHLLQHCTGVDENAVGAFFQLVFAPVDELFSDDAPLLPSGFRIIPLDSKSDQLSTKTLDLASSLESGQALNRAGGEKSIDTCSTRSVLTIAFQFPYEIHLQDNVATMARQYIRSIISAVQRVSLAITPRNGFVFGRKVPLSSPEATTFSRWICQSYSYHLGVDLLGSDSEASGSLLRMLWLHQDAILCCSLKEAPVFTFANQAGLDMLETTLVALQDISLESILDEHGRRALCSEFAKLMQQGFSYLPAGTCTSSMGRRVSYEQALSWKVFGEDGSIHCLAFSFINWSFI